MDGKCWIKRGFFVLRDCENRPFMICAMCNRPFCAECASEQDPNICVDCAARTSESFIGGGDAWFFTEPPASNSPASQAEMEAKARHDHFAREGYAPISIGREDAYYTMYDVRSFAPGPNPMGGGLYGDDPAQAGFGIS